MRSTKSAATKETVHYRLETCPDRDKHTPAPYGYIEWHVWAERKGKTHRQKRCSTCGLWAIWVPKKARKDGSSP